MTVITDKITTFFTKYTPHTFGKGEILVQGGTQPAGIFYLRRGNVIQYDISSNGDKAAVNVYKPGAFFPMAWAMNKTPNRYFFEATTECEIYRAPADDAIAFIKEQPDILYDLLSRVYKGLDGVLERMVYLMGGDARTRLVLELVIACRRFGEQNADGSVTISLNETELAARAGLSRETVSRQISQLKNEHLITVSSHSLRIIHVGALEAQLA